jgi:hypothetical protein
VLVVENSARGKQCYTGRNSRLLTGLSAPRDSKFLIANLELEFHVSPIRITKLKFSNRKYFAIACPEERRVYPEVRRAHPEERRACPGERRVHPEIRRACLGARSVHPVPMPCTIAGSRAIRPRRPNSNIRITEKELSCTKERRKQNSNSNKIAFSGTSASRAFSREISALAHRSPIVSAAAPLSSAPNLAIMDFPMRGHL